MTEETTIFTNLQNVITTATSVATVVLGYFAYKKNSEIKSLKEKNEYLKKTVHKITSKVDPESDRKLIVEAERNIQIMGINSLGPLHHCREEIIQFLKDKNKKLRLVLLDPRGHEFQSREKFEHDNSRRLYSEWVASLSIVKDIQEKSQGNIEVRLRQDAPDRSLLIIDSISTVDELSKMLINYYPDQESMRGYEGVQFLSEFAMERDRDSFFRNLDYYSDCWEKAEFVELQILYSIGATKIANKANQHGSK